MISSRLEEFIPTLYRHTQVGYPTVLILGIAFVGELYRAALTPRPGLIVALVLVGMLLVLFSTLTVIVQDHMVEVFFGPGLIRRRISLGRIRDVQTVRTPWYYGWGIRLTPYGWLWSAAGHDGIEIWFHDGGRFRIGSDEPEKLAEVLRQQIRYDGGPRVQE